MSCNLEQALAKVEKLLKFSAIQKNIPFEIRRIEFEIKAMISAKNKMLNGPEEVLGTSENIKIDHGTDYSKLIASLENRVKDYTKYVTKDANNINVHRSRKVDNKTEYLPFGNPFSKWSTGESDDSILSAMFYRWVVNNEVPASYLSEESAEVRAKRLGGINTARKNIITQLKNIANKDLYYEGTARDKNLSHASALALIADLYNKGTLTIDINSKQNVLKASSVEVKPSKETTYEVPSKQDKTTKVIDTPSENLDTPTNNKLDDEYDNTKDSEPIKDKKSEVGKSGIEGLKSQQEEAAVKMINMLNSDTDSVFMLEGEAGTGKSYTVSKVLAQYMQNPNHSEVLTVAAATAHKAKDVIGDMIDEVLQSVDNDSDRKVKRVVDLRLPSILSDTESRKVVVLDEVSMVSPETMADIKRALDKAASEGVRHKVIMLGDRAQLRPVINIMNANNIIAYKNDYTGHYVFKKNAYDLGIDGSFDGENFVPNNSYRTDAVLPAKLNTDGSLTIDASSMLLKSFLFRDLGNTPNKLKHKLDEQQRNTTATFAAIRKFRTDNIETSLNAENTKSYNEQLNDAIKGLTKVGAVLLNDSNSKVPKKVMNDIRDGKGVFLSYTNNTVDIANTLFTNIFAKETGVKENIESAETYGVFAGQRVFSVSNIYADTSKVTNNTQGTVVKLEDISDVNSSITVYDSDRVYNIAKDLYSYMWNFGTNKPIEPKVSVWLNTDDLIADKVNVLKAVGINIETEEDGQQYLVDVMINNTSKNAIVKYVKDNKEEFRKYDPMILEKNEDGRALTAFLLKYGNITMEVTTKDVDETLTVSIGEMLESSIKDKYPKKVYAKDVVELFKGVAAPYAQTVHKSQGSTFNSVISDNSTNYYQSTVNKLETLYVAYSRSKGDIVIAPNILSNLSGYKTSETESALDEYLAPDLTPEASNKSEESIISDKAPDTEHKVTISELMRCLNSYKG